MPFTEMNHLSSPKERNHIPTREIAIVKCIGSGYDSNRSDSFNAGFNQITDGKLWGEFGLHESTASGGNEIELNVALPLLRLLYLSR
jgi:hypothetical protein